MLKMPLLKQLSYIFAGVAGEDVLCSHLLQETTEVPVHAGDDPTLFAYNMERYNFRWLEASPVENEPGQYAVISCLYTRNSSRTATGDRSYSETLHELAGPSGPYYKRDQAVALIKNTETAWRAQGMGVVSDAPSALDKVSVYKPAAKP